MAGPTDTTRTARANARPHLLTHLAAVHAAGGTLPCPRCGHPMSPWQDLDVGHEVDVADGGADSPLRLEHRGCNRAAGDRRRPRHPDHAEPHINSRDW